MQKSQKLQRANKVATKPTTKSQLKRKPVTRTPKRKAHTPNTTSRRYFTAQTNTQAPQTEKAQEEVTPLPLQPFNIPLNQPVPSDISLNSETTRVSTTPRISTLKNGIKIISQDSTFPIVYVNARIGVGTINESPTETGFTVLLARLMSEHMNQLTDRMANGTEVRPLPNRDAIDIHASTVGTLEDALFPVWSLVVSPQWSEPDITEDVKNFFTDYSLPSRNATPSERFDDDIHHNAFYGKALGNRSFPTDESLQYATKDNLIAFQQKFFTANRITLSAVGVDHDELVQKCEELFGEMPTSPFTNDGDVETFDDLQVAHSHQYLPDYEGNVAPGAPNPDATQHVALSWHGPDVNSPFLVPMTVLSTVIGSARSFSSGGPGKGMHARATTRLLGPRAYVEEVSAFFSPYPRTSLFGLQGVVQGNKTNKFIDEMLDELTSMSENITDVEVERAKNQLKRQLFAHHEKASMRVIELGRHSAVYGKWKADEFIEEIEKVTTAQVRQSAKLLFDADSVLITTLGNPRNVSPKWFSRSDGSDKPFTQKELDKVHNEMDKARQSEDPAAWGKLKSMFGF